MLQRPDGELKSLIAHELFHILSRADPKLRDSFYKIIGFTKCNEVSFPKLLAERKLTNPDAPFMEHCIELNVNEEELKFMPLTLLSTDKFEGGPFFKFLQFVYVQLEEKEGKLAIPDEAKLIEPDALPGLQAKIGRNTTYVIHPEEIMADNFVHLLLEEKDLPDPWIVEAMRKAIESRK